MAQELTSDKDLLMVLANAEGWLRRILHGSKQSASDKEVIRQAADRCAREIRLRCKFDHTSLELDYRCDVCEVLKAILDGHPPNPGACQYCISTEYGLHDDMCCYQKGREMIDEHRRLCAKCVTTLTARCD